MQRGYACKNKKPPRLSPGRLSEAVCCSRLLAVVGKRFHQRHHLALYGLAFDSAISAQQPQAECAVEEQEALDLPALVVAVVEERHRHVERVGDLLQPGGADAVDALLVFLDLLKAHTQLLAEIR